MLTQCACGARQPNFLTPYDPHLTPRYTLEPLDVSNWSMIGKSQSSLTGGDRLPARSILFSTARAALSSVVVAMTRRGGTLPFVETTSRSEYLSGCIPQVLGRVSRSMPEQSEVAIFASDFGFRTDRPLEQFQIYDDAWSLDLNFAEAFLERAGRAYISSLPKVFGLPFGGLAMLSDDIEVESDLSKSQETILRMLLEVKIPQLEEIGLRRRENLIYLEEKMNPWELQFSTKSANIPGAAVIKPKFSFDEEDFKRRINAHGVRSTSFFGNQAVLIPVHQGLSRLDLDYLLDVTGHCLKESKSR